MVTPSLAAHFTERGVPLIPLAAGAHAFVTEIDTDDTVQVLLGAGEPHHTPFAADVTVHARTHDYLLDHAPAGTPVLPLAIAIEWFAATSRSRNHDASLRDIQVLRRIDLPDLATGHSFTVESNADELRLIGSSGTAHCRARLATPNFRTHPWTPVLGTGVDSIYDHPALFHGPRFQALHRVDALSDNGADAHVVGLRDLGWPGGPWWTDPAAIDGALQAAVLWASHATGAATLPMGLDALRVHRPGPAPAALRCLVRAVSVQSGQARCDALLLDADGRPRAELLGVNLIRRPDLASA
jgi:hypothetical protein